MDLIWIPLTWAGAAGTICKFDSSLTTDYGDLR